MARSKNLHYVQHEVEIIQQEDPESNWADGVIQVDVKLSEELGRTIRNGNSFRLVGYGASLAGFSGASDIDVGFAGTAKVQFAPVTKNSVAAHQKMYKQWMRQKQLAGAVGDIVRYDDFEVGWTGGFSLGSVRNSTLRATGLDDSDSEYIMLYGSSVQGDRISLADYYDSMSPIAVPSTDAFGAVIKEPKFENKFPEWRTLIMPTSYSAQVEDATLPDSYSGGIANGDIQWLPADNHLSHLTGTLYYFFKGVAPTEGGSIPDELKLTITLVYEGWSSLAPDTRKQITRRSSSKKTSRKA